MSTCNNEQDLHEFASTCLNQSTSTSSWNEIYFPKDYNWREIGEFELLYDPSDSDSEYDSRDYELSGDSDLEDVEVNLKDAERMFKLQRARAAREKRENNYKKITK